MELVSVRRMVNNMEIICKLLNSVAKKCGCRFKYNPQSGTLQFYSVDRLTLLKAFETKSAINVPRRREQRDR